MTPLEIILGIIQIVLSIVLIVVIILQSGKAAGLSGVIAGGAETFFGRNKGRTMESKLEKWTTALAVAFMVITMILNFI